MKKPPTPYAAIAVVALTATVFVYFSCSSKEPDGTAATDSIESFGNDLPDDGKALDLAEADLKAVLATNCSEISEGSDFCSEKIDQKTVGK